LCDCITYIVDYIVKQTVGKMIEGKSPDEIAGVGRPAGSPLRILDPACGSGSFLLGAYQLLLDHHLNWYVNHRDDKQTRDRIYESATGWRLTTAEKKRILLNNIFGVDIDRQAVEVTKLSLLLKVLEGETQETLGKQLSLFKERALPNLDANIRCGNSLIGMDYFAGQLMPDADELRRVNPLDWVRAFPDAMRDGGFDVVIGNLPYIRIQTMKEWAPLEVEIYKERYAAASSGNYDIYVVLVEKGLSLLNARGRLGFILPHKFFNAQYGKPLRELIARGKHLAHVVHFGDQQVFAGATTYTCLMFLDKAGSDECRFVKVDDLNAWRADGKATVGAIPPANITSAEWDFTVGKSAALFDKLAMMPVKLENVTSRIFQGIKTSADKVYIVEELERKGKKVKVYSREKEAEYWLETDLLHPLIKGGDSKRYHLTRTNRLILFPYANRGDVTELISDTELKTRYPLTWAYLMDNKKYLENREDGKMRGSRWYGYGRTQALDVIPLPKIFTPDIAARSSFSLDASGEVFFTGGVAGGYGILVLPEFSREYILGILNSRLLEWLIHQTATQMCGGYYSYESRFIRGLPIRAINFADPADKARHDRMVALVTQMLELHQRLHAARAAADREMWQRQIDATDAAIDALVYELYGLTEEEVRVVEGK